ncbi:MAG TPA: hypothetical protein VET85_04080 [Stellaceae bacterium]|nr:hypothetical protein [Stellaceae bacterium]
MRQGDLVRLVRILGMLGSDHAGERASAALAAHRLVKASGETWTALLSPFKAPRGQPRRREWVDVFHDPVSAASSRMRQLRRENDELLRELRRLRQGIYAARGTVWRSSGLKRPSGVR